MIRIPTIKPKIFIDPIKWIRSQHPSSASSSQLAKPAELRKNQKKVRNRNLRIRSIKNFEQGLYAFVTLQKP